MSTRPHLVRSVPFWGLVAVSLATAAGGAYLLSDRLGTMTTALTAGTATPVDVYVGQSVAVVAGIVLGAGIVGILLALDIAALATLRPRTQVEPVEAADANDEVAVDAEPAAGHGYERGLGYTEAVPTVGATADATEEAGVPTR